MSVRVRLCAAGRLSIEHSFPKDASLRDVQQELCGLCRKRFPWESAAVTVNGVTFDDFIDKPFVSAVDGERVNVVFAQSTDMYWIDFFYRQPKKREDTFEALPLVAFPIHTGSTPIDTTPE